MTDPTTQYNGEELAPIEIGHEVVVFTVGKESFALPLESLAEIYKTAEITSLPLAPEFLVGVINVHGNLASVISLPAILGAGKAGMEGLLLILTQDQGGFAVLVNSTTGFTSYVTLEDVALARGASSVEFIEGVFRDGGKLITLINPEKLRVWIDSEFAKGDD